MTPWVLRLLMANAIVFLLQVTMPGVIENLFAFVPSQVLTRPWTIVTYMFVHGGFGHIFFNMLALFFFGGEVLRGFAFTMIVGIITGTYSSVFVAAAIVTFWRRTKPSKLSTAAPAAVATSTTPARAAASRKSKSQRKARAS